MLSLKRLLTANVIKSQLPVLAELTIVRSKHSHQHSLTYGTGKRNSFNGNVVTVFGATGVVGRSLINELARTGTQLIVPFRSSEDDIRDIRLAGDLGQIVFVKYSIRDYESIVKSMSHSNVAINLVGKNYETRHFSYKDALVDGAAAIASAAAECGVSNLIHVSHLQQDEASPSIFMRMKALGEKAVLEKFPTATIMRPAEVYGMEDQYLNRFAYMRKLPMFPLAGTGYDVKKLPIYIADVVNAISSAVMDPTTAGKVYELVGPEEYHLREIIEYVFMMIKEDLNVINVPQKLYERVGWAIEQSFFHARWTQELVQREYLSEVATPGALGLADLGVKPTNMNEVGIGILRRHREPIYQDQMLKDDEEIRPSRVIDEMLAEIERKRAAEVPLTPLDKLKEFQPRAP